MHLFHHLLCSGLIVHCVLFTISLLGWSHQLDIIDKLHQKLKFNSDTTRCEGSQLNLFCKLNDNNVNGTLSIHWLQEAYIPQNLVLAEQAIPHLTGQDRIPGLKTLTLEEAFRKYGIHLVNRSTVGGETWLNLTIGPLENKHAGIYICFLDIGDLLHYMRLTIKVGCEPSYQKWVWTISACASILVLIALYGICRYYKHSKPIRYKLILVTPEHEYTSSSNQSTKETTDSDRLESSTYGRLDNNYSIQQPIIYPSVRFQTISDQQSTKYVRSFGRSSNSGRTTTTTSSRFDEYGNRLKQMNDRFRSLYRVEPDLDYEFGRENLELGSCLGSGAFGAVYLGVAKNLPNQPKDSVSVAVKTLRDNFTESDVIDMMKEIFVMKQLHHEHVIELYAVCTQDGAPYLIMEYAPHGNLQSYLRSRRHILETKNSTVELLLDYAYQIADGMRYLASKSLVHRDLAARNILVGKNDTLKISDFGLTRMVEYYYRKESKGRIPIKWMAPECLFDRIYTTKSDVWSFGVLLWEIFSFGASPFKDTSPQLIPAMVRAGHRNPKPELASDQIYSLMTECWALEPGHRPSFEQLAQHLLFLWKHEKESLAESVSPIEDRMYEFSNDEQQTVCSTDPSLTEPVTYPIRGSDTLSTESLSTQYAKVVGFVCCGDDEDEKTKKKTDICSDIQFVHHQDQMAIQTE